MPYKSDKQRRYMHAAADRGGIDRAVVEEFDRHERAKKKPKLKRKKD